MSGAGNGRAARTAAVLLAVAMLAAAMPAGWNGGPARAATARRETTIGRDVVKLSDLFSGLPPAQDLEIGPAPAPGRSITVPEPQLAAIAAQFGVDWQPSPGFVSTTLRRGGRSVTPDEVLAAVRPALDAATSRPDGQVTLLPFAGPMLPAEFAGAPEVIRLDPPTPDGRFAATLRFTPPDAEPVELHVGGRIEDTVPALVLARPLSAGSVLQPGDLVPARLPRQRTSGTALTDPADAVGLRIARAAGAGTPVSAAMLERPPAVAKNHPVVLRLQGDGLTLTASGTALEAGSLGDVIHVLNTASRAVLLGRVVNNTDIRIEPGTAPVPAAGNGMGGGAGNGGWRAGPGRMS